MRRLKKEIRDRKEQFTISVSKITPKFFWENCHWCDYEFRREEGTLIILTDNNNPTNNNRGYAVCNKCSNGVDLETMKKVWEQSDEFKRFRTDEFTEFLESGDY